MLERQIRLLRSVARSVAVVGGTPGSLTSAGVSHVPDIVTGRGPLAGIYSALLMTRMEFNMVLGCDLPFINRLLLSYIAGRALTGRSDVTIPRSHDGKLQPLCAVYRRRAIYAIRTSLAAGESKLRTFFPRVKCDVIPWTDLARAGFQPSIFDNMNTPEVYENVRRRLEAYSAPSA